MYVRRKVPIGRRLSYRRSYVRRPRVRVPVSGRRGSRVPRTIRRRIRR